MTQFFRALAKLKTGQAKANKNIPWAYFEQDPFTKKMAIIWICAYFEPLRKLGSLSHEPGAFLLQAKNSAQAFKSGPRLVPPLALS